MDFEELEDADRSCLSASDVINEQVLFLAIGEMRGWISANMGFSGLGIVVLDREAARTLPSKPTDW